MGRKRTTGFTLVELLIVVVIIAIIAALAVPNMLSSRRAANEAAAIATLRQLSSSQSEVKTSGMIDGDGDGVGEYAYFGELAGTHFVRTFVGGAQVISATVKLLPPVASGAFGNVMNGRVTRSGYLFKIILPGPTGLAVPEAPTGGGDASALPDPDNSEVVWCAYAWPVSIEGTGTRVFFVNEQGDILQTNNTLHKYQGATEPPPHAAFAPGDAMNGIKFATCASTSLKKGMDEETWSNVN